MAANRRQSACPPTPSTVIDLTDDSPSRPPQPAGQPQYSRPSTADSTQCIPSDPHTGQMSHPQFSQRGFTMPNSNYQPQQIPFNMTPQQLMQYQQQQELRRRQLEAQGFAIGNGHQGPVFNSQNYTQGTTPGLRAGPQMVAQPRPTSMAMNMNMNVNMNMMDTRNIMQAHLLNGGMANLPQQFQPQLLNDNMTNLPQHIQAQLMSGNMRPPTATSSNNTGQFSHVQQAPIHTSFPTTPMQAQFNGASQHIHSPQQEPNLRLAEQQVNAQMQQFNHLQMQHQMQKQMQQQAEENQRNAHQTPTPVLPSNPAPPQPGQKRQIGNADIGEEPPSKRRSVTTGPMPSNVGVQYQQQARGSPYAPNPMNGTLHPISGMQSMQNVQQQMGRSPHVPTAMNGISHTVSGMQNVQNMKNPQNMQNMQNMQNTQNMQSKNMQNVQQHRMTTSQSGNMQQQQMPSHQNQHGGPQLVTSKKINIRAVFSHCLDMLRRKNGESLDRAQNPVRQEELEAVQPLYDQQIKQLQQVLALEQRQSQLNGNNTIVHGSAHDNTSASHQQAHVAMQRQQYQEKLRQQQIAQQINQQMSSQQQAQVQQYQRSQMQQQNVQQLQNQPQTQHLTGGVQEQSRQQQILQQQILQQQNFQQQNLLQQNFQQQNMQQQNLQQNFQQQNSQQQSLQRQNFQQQNPQQQSLPQQTLEQQERQQQSRQQHIQQQRRQQQNLQRRTNVDVPNSGPPLSGHQQNSNQQRQQGQSRHQNEVTQQPMSMNLSSASPHPSLTSLNQTSSSPVAQQFIDQSQAVDEMLIEQSFPQLQQVSRGARDMGRDPSSSTGFPAAVSSPLVQQVVLSSPNTSISSSLRDANASPVLPKQEMPVIAQPSVDIFAQQNSILIEISHAPSSSPSQEKPQPGSISPNHPASFESVAPTMILSPSTTTSEQTTLIEKVMETPVEASNLTVTSEGQGFGFVDPFSILNPGGDWKPLESKHADFGLFSLNSSPELLPDEAEAVINPDFEPHDPEVTLEQQLKHFLEFLHPASPDNPKEKPNPVPSLNWDALFHDTNSSEVEEEEEQAVEGAKQAFAVNTGPYISEEDAFTHKINQELGAAWDALANAELIPDRSAGEVGTKVLEEIQNGERVMNIWDFGHVSDMVGQDNWGSWD